MAFVALLLLVTPFAAPALAQNSRDSAHADEPGQFDFYVLSLSWSPSFCAEAAERHATARPAPQCGARPYSFVVHGLWPQYDKGFPEYCQSRRRGSITASSRAMLDLMPAPHLIYNEWDKHGTCSGLSAARLFRDRAQSARGGENPARLCRACRTALNVTPGAVEDAFVKANPGLSPAASRSNATSGG